jgi:hypothetical protein
MNNNIRGENEKQKGKIKKLKANLDRSGVEMRASEDNIGREQEQP